MHTILLIQGLRKTIKTFYTTNFHSINKIGDNESIAEIERVRGYTSCLQVQGTIQTERQT